MPTTVTRLLLLALLLLAFALRVYALDRYPTGVSPDEAGDVIDILNIAHSGRFPIYEDYAIPEPLHRILYALLSLLVGNSVGSIRFLGACFGVLTVALVGWVARLGFRSAAPGRDQVANQLTDQTADPTTGQTVGSLENAEDNTAAMQETLMVVASVAMLTLSLSHIVISRSIYRAILQPVFTLFFLGYLLSGLAHYRWRDYSTSGMSLALTLYSYTAGMVVPGVIGLLGLQLLVTRIRSWRRWLPSLVLLGVVFLLCIAPILYTLWTAPHFVIGRASELNDGPKAAIGWNEIVRMVNQFVVAGDVNLQYNIASAPLVSTLWLPFFVVGLMALLVKIRKPVSVLLGGLLILATIPVIFAGEIPHGLRIMGVFAVLPLIIGTGFADATRLLWRLPLLKQLSTQKQFVFSLVLLVALIGVQSYQSVTGYFLYWSTAAPQQTNFIFNRQLPSNEWYFRPDRRDLAAWIRSQSTPLLLQRVELAQLN